MNAPIRRLYVLIVGLFVLLIAFTSRWTVFERDSLRANTLNRRELIEQQRIHRGTLRAADGTLLARSVQGKGGFYSRRYPDAAKALSHAVGYSYLTIGRAGLEASRNGPLTGADDALTSFVDQLKGSQPVGRNVVTNLDPKAQTVALNGLAGRKGAVVALDPRTGAVRVFASNPGFDPATVGDPKVFRALNRDPDAPLFDRVTQSGYPPGSTFKVVTAIAALDSGRFTKDSVLSGRNGIPISGVPLNNDANESYGDVNLTFALTKSINTVWAQVAERLGKATMARYMNRLGFEAKPPIDLPRDQRRASGEYRGETLLKPTSRFVDVGRMGIGQDKLAVTPLQMAMVASAVANGGVLMKPRLAARAVDRDGRTVQRFAPESAGRAMSAQTASDVRDMMTQVVKEGTGTAAALQGISVAGKTGTAEKDPARRINQPWFIAFAPAENPRIAIAATVETSVGGFGGTVAAPIAKSVLQELLGEAANG